MTEYMSHKCCCAYKQKRCWRVVLNCPHARHAQPHDQPTQWWPLIIGCALNHLHPHHPSTAHRQHNFEACQTYFVIKTDSQVDQTVDCLKALWPQQTLVDIQLLAAHGLSFSILAL